MSGLGYPYDWFMAEAEAVIEFGLRRVDSPKVCAMQAILWLEKALKTSMEERG